VDDGFMIKFNNATQCEKDDQSLQTSASNFVLTGDQPIWRKADSCTDLACGRRQCGSLIVAPAGAPLPSSPSYQTSPAGALPPKRGGLGSLQQVET